MPLRAFFDQINASKTRCNGRCQKSPIMLVQPDGIGCQKLDTEIA